MNYNKFYERIQNTILTPNHSHTIRLFRMVVYSWVILNTLMLLPIGKLFWSFEALIPLQNFQQLSLWEQATHLLHQSKVADFWPFFVIGQILFAILAILNKYPRLSSLMVYFFTINLDNRASVIMDGGNNLIQILLFLLIFMTTNNHKGIFAIFSTGLSKATLLLARIQVVFVYACAGLGKVTGELWPKGVALYYTMNVHEYSHPFFGQLMTDFPLFMVAGAYSVLFFQLSFPWLVWNKKITPWLLAFGTFFHLGIVFGMGLVSFGFAMCASYFVFYDDLRAKKLLHTLFGWTRLHVGFDDNCNVCQKFANIIKVITTRNSLNIDSAQNPTNKILQDIPLNKRLTEIYAIDENGKVFSGYAVIVEILRRVPFGFIFLPLAFLIGYVGIGEKLYQRIASAKWRKSCKDGICGI